MNKVFILTISMFIISLCCFAQNNTGGRLLGMGNNTIAVKDIWSINGNPAGITGLNKPTLALSYGKSITSTEISNQGLAFVIPFNRNFAGLSIQRYGITEYNEINAGIALTKAFSENFAIGIKLNYHQIKITNYGSTNGFSADVGLMYKYNGNLTFGASVSNPTLQKYKTQNLSAQIPTTFSLGASYNASNKILVASYIKKELDKAFDVGLGIDYNILEVLSLRGGLTAKSFKQYAGFGIRYKHLTFDGAVESDPNLGYSPQIALAYAF